MQYSNLGRLYVNLILKDTKVFEILDATYPQYSPKSLSPNDPELVTRHDILTNHIIINNIFEICLGSISKKSTCSGVLDSHSIQK